MSIKVISGNVTLIGIDAKMLSANNDQRIVLHKWGNAWASSEDFVHIDKEVFSSALKQLDPDKVVILLGTNDYNLDNRDAADFKSNLKELTERIKKALPHTQVLIVSTFNTDGEASKTIFNNIPGNIFS
jgi:lysophospholipase L1-like esterase